MQAVVMRAFGGPEVLRVEDVAVPRPGPGEVLIKVEAVSVNRTLDLAVRAGTYARPARLPHVLGTDPSGTIVALGDGVTARKAGDRVTTSPRIKAATPESPPIILGVQAWGGYAQYVTLPAANTHVLPDTLDFGAATVVARHAPLAFNQLQARARVRPGEWVLVMGAAGGLGSAAVQVAKYLGARVIAAAGSEERVKAAQALGADASINYRAADLFAETRRITQGRGVDVVIENIGDAALFPKAFASLGRNGRLVTAGAHAGGKVALDLHYLYLNYIEIIGSPSHTDSDVELSLKVAAEGGLTPLIDRELPLAEAAAAHRLVEAREGIGKVVLRPWVP